MENYSKVQTSARTYRLVKAIFLIIFVCPVVAALVGFFLASNSTEVMLIGFFGTWFLLTVLLIMWPMKEYNHLGFNLQSNALALKKGFLSLQKVTIPFSRITNASFTQSPFQRIFGVGDVIIDQEDSGFVLDGIDKVSADKILKEVSSKSNIQPITKNRSSEE